MLLQKRQKDHYNMASRMLPSVELGQSVYVQKTPGGKWSTARIIAQSVSLQSYTVKTEGGSIIRQNRVHLSSCQGNTSKTQVSGHTIIALTPFITLNKSQPPPTHHP